MGPVPTKMYLDTVSTTGGDGDVPSARTHVGVQVSVSPSAARAMSTWVATRPAESPGGRSQVPLDLVEVAHHVVELGPPDGLHRLAEALERLVERRLQRGEVGVEAHNVFLPPRSRRVR